MNFDLTSLVEIIQKLVNFMRDVNFTIGESKFNLWACILALGSLEVISYIFDGVSFYPSDNPHYNDKDD